MPSNVVSDPTVLGGKRGSLTIDSGTVAELRTQLQALFNYGDLSGNASLILSPMPTFAGLPACAIPGSKNPCCTLGTRHVCLQFRREPTNTIPGVSLFDPRPGWVTLDLDPARVWIPPGGSSVPWYAVAEPLAPTAVDLSVLQSDGSLPAVDADPFFMLGRMVPGPDREFILRMHPADLKVETRNGQTGLWMPITLTPVDGVLALNSCTWKGPGSLADGTFGTTQCTKMLEEMHKKLAEKLGEYGIDGSEVTCDGFEVLSAVLVLRFYLGLLPELVPCSPDRIYQVNPKTDWMRNVPFGERYRQSCLRVRPVVASGIRVAPYEGGDVNILHVKRLGCRDAIENACTFLPGLDCVDEAVKNGAASAEKSIADQLSDTLGGQLLPFFAYNGAGGPFDSVASPPGCDPNTASCVSFIRKHGVPASLTALAYGWFAKAFGSQQGAGFAQFPVVGVEPHATCPGGYNRRPGRVPGEVDVCVLCLPDPVGYPCHYDQTSLRCLSNVPLATCPQVVVPTTTSVEFSYAVDPDADGVDEHLDNCPGTFNPAQTDTDGDGMGDACDACPCDEDGGDPDGDQVCNTACNGVAADNCPDVANPFQENCNLDAEVAREAEVLGDVCDPVPCPHFVAKTSTSVVPGTSLNGKGEARTVLTSLRFRPFGSFDRAAATPTQKTATVPHTDYRHCIQDDSEGVNCFAKEAVDEVLLNPIVETKEGLWHSVQMQGRDVGAQEGNLFYHTNLSYSRTWCWNMDYERWRTTSWGQDWVPSLAGVDPSLFPCVPAKDPVSEPSLPFSLPGRFWTHANTPIGTTDNTLGTGIHLLKQPAVPANGLANHYEAVDAYHRSVNLNGPLPLEFFPVIDRDCPYCAPALGLPARECTVCTLEALPELSERVSRVLAVLPSGDAGVLTTAGTIAPLRVPLSESLSASFAAGLSWVNQAEPSVNLGWGWSAPVAVGVVPDTGAVQEHVYSANGQLYSYADVLGTVIGPGPSLQSTAAKHGPPANSEAEVVRVYSRSRGRIYHFGGAAAPLLGQLTISILGEEGFQSVGLDQELGTVRAATYSHTDRLLWAVDELPTHWKHFVSRRLLTIDPESGHVQVILERKSLRHWFRPYLVTDRDGSVLLALSGKLAPKHLLLRFHREGTELQVETSKLRKGRLAMAPVVDGEGYWLVAHSPAKKKSPIVERLEALPLKPVSSNACASEGL
ncbi:MAG: thrombospondin type 3 repeat-containing protein [Polyangiaceae bacterium]